MKPRQPPRTRFRIALLPLGAYCSGALQALALQALALLAGSCTGSKDESPQISSGTLGCRSDAECPDGQECGLNNGAYFGLPRKQRVCWPGFDCWFSSYCEMNPDCGSNCSGYEPCDDPTAACPDGEVCGEGFAVLFTLRPNSGNACVDPVCLTNEGRVDQCGTREELCGFSCACFPDCSNATCRNPSSGCDDQTCPGVCAPMEQGCRSDLHCTAGYGCVAYLDGSTQCIPIDCFYRTVEPPECGSLDSPCGLCPMCTPQCGTYVCGPDPACGSDCGTCPEETFCNGLGQCVTPTR